MTCDPKSVAAAAACFCFPPKTQSDVTLYLLCQWANKGGGGCILPGAPQDLGAVGGANQVTLTWGAAALATGYNIKRSLVPGGPYVTINTAAASPYVDNTVTGGTTYYYVVSATNVCGEGPNSNESSACAVTAAPTNLVATAGNNQITLTWTAAVGATGYNIKRSLVMGGPYATIDTSAGSPYVDGTAANGTTYFYVVSATNPCGESANSNEATETPNTFTFAPPTEIINWNDANGGFFGNLATFEAIADIPTVSAISMDGTAITSISGFDSLPNLQVINLNSIPTLATVTISNCPLLNIVAASNSGLTNITFINCPSITSLTATNDFLTNFASIDISTLAALTFVNVRAQTLDVNCVDNILVALDGFGLLNGSAVMDMQTPAAIPDSGPPDGATAAANLAGNGWVVVTDT